MRGFRTAGSVREVSSHDPVDHHDPASSHGTSLVEQVLYELTHGSTASMVAERHGLPRDFVNLILERAQRDGTVDVVELTSGSCTKGTCDPDPESLVCAGCPIMPAAIRRKQSLMGRLLHRQ